MPGNHKGCPASQGLPTGGTEEPLDQCVTRRRSRLARVSAGCFEQWLVFRQIRARTDRSTPVRGIGEHHGDIREEDGTSDKNPAQPPSGDDSKHEADRAQPHGKQVARLATADVYASRWSSRRDRHGLIVLLVHGSLLPLSVRR